MICEVKFTVQIASRGSLRQDRKRALTQRTHPSFVATTDLFVQGVWSLNCCGSWTQFLFSLWSSVFVHSLCEMWCFYSLTCFNLEQQSCVRTLGFYQPMSVCNQIHHFWEFWLHHHKLRKSSLKVFSAIANRWCNQEEHVVTDSSSLFTACLWSDHWAFCSQYDMWYRDGWSCMMSISYYCHFFSLPSKPVICMTDDWQWCSFKMLSAPSVLRSSIPLFILSSWGGGGGGTIIYVYNKEKNFSWFH